MSSSDSDDDCYGNIAQKLQTIKSKYETKKTGNIVNDETSEHCQSKETSKKDCDTSIIIPEDCNVTVNSTDNEEFSLDAIIANNTKPAHNIRRSAKRKSTDSNDETYVPSEFVRPTRQKTGRRNASRKAKTPRVEPATTQLDPENSEQSTSTAWRGRGSRRGRGARGQRASPRGRGRGRGRSRNRTLELFANFCNWAASATYSVGNTEEYPDECDNVQLFAPTTTNNDVEIVETDPLCDDNEEMSVKVYWQNLEIFKFNIRKYQKLKQIFDFFADKERVGYDKLLFMYNETILKIDDTPESINYSIAKFIDGGIVNQNVTKLIQENGHSNVDSGIKIKFQCQNLKKPYETRLRPEDTLKHVMMKCAEHMEVPMERLKFYFDGDLISSKNTAQDLELEGGECIDVKICS